jgi:hypothetical protein
VRARAFALAALPSLALACSTASLAPDAGMDASSGPQPIGAPCDPSIPAPCLPTGDRCLAVVCDPATRTCAERATDAGPPCNGGAAPCTTSADCDVGLSCAFSVAAGCTAAGQCLDPSLLCQNDAAACRASGFSCGCDGKPAANVAPGYAAAPSSGPPPCAAPGDASSAAGDASSDG